VSETRPVQSETPGVISMRARVLRDHRLRLAIYLAASWLFYIILDVRFFPLLLGSSAFNFLFGRVIRKCPRTSLLWVGVLCNVLLLSVFKYLPALRPFFPDNAVLAGLAVTALPVGISFWTFQALSYLIDQYREQEIQPSFFEFCLYMSFAPTVVSGPICRVGELVPQFRRPLPWSWQAACEGAQSIWVGLGMVALARVLGSGFGGHGVEAAFANAVPDLSTADAWILLIGYGFEIFFDFAGYSRLVIGIARILGIRLPENFNRPYLSTNPTQFWQRWHMSLSFWIRDYVFMPAAMMRSEMWWRRMTLVFSMVVFGLWHRASWLFLLWGVYQGTLLLLHRTIQQLRRGSETSVAPALRSGVGWLVTFLAINLSWILFRAADLAQAGRMFSVALIPRSGMHLPGSFVALVLVMVGGYFVSQVIALGAQGEATGELSWMPLTARFACYAGIFYLIVFRSAEPQAFIYSQF
jgi:D-alanyl-lipoteichoic acid acyltransferase DltB (MBOAT superfamily)